MGKTLIGIIASPRKAGNCELFIKKIFLQLGKAGNCGWRAFPNST